MRKKHTSQRIPILSCKSDLNDVCSGLGGSGVPLAPSWHLLGFPGPPLGLHGLRSGEGTAAAAAVGPRGGAVEGEVEGAGRGSTAAAAAVRPRGWGRRGLQLKIY